MTEGFHKHRRSGRVIAEFTGSEADLLRSLASQLVELLHSEVAAPVEHDDPMARLFDFTGPTTAPEDPVLQRLFPTAYVEDEEAAGEFRRFTEGALRDGKARGARAIIEALEESGLPADDVDDAVHVDVELDEGEAMAWLKSFTDIRLALATRLGVEEGDEERWAALPDDDPAAQAHDIYDWVGYLQETLVEALSA
ncbi:DUF2017 domain-containing protein [Nocardioides phosphati]|uniref:DUF2017 domain-containing protein n=1 Tax=Nocardioides phosphati TaxID=1867775 RepID=UPI00166D6DE2|nr:DUF2017 domain-containing protein [Nocardioides phosphati]